MNKELKAVVSRVVTNITNEERAYLNTREIDVPNGSLIVLGFIERVCKGGEINNAYVMMSVYDSGSINDTVYFNDGMVLFSTCKSDDTGNKISADDGFMETQSWWRIPTDDEVTLYENIYPQHLVEKIEDVLDNLDNLEKEDIRILLERIKEKAEKMF